MFKKLKNKEVRLLFHNGTAVSGKIESFTRKMLVLSNSNTENDLLILQPLKNISMIYVKSSKTVEKAKELPIQELPQEEQSTIIDRKNSLMSKILATTSQNPIEEPNPNIAYGIPNLSRNAVPHSSGTENSGNVAENSSALFQAFLQGRRSG